MEVCEVLDCEGRGKVFTVNRNENETMKWLVIHTFYVPTDCYVPTDRCRACV